jgi:hypothetical protein
MVDSNIKLNDPSITVISDRSAAIKRAIDDNVGLAYHAYCPLHIERNLKARHWAAHLNLYHAARRAENEHIFLVRMAKIEVVCPEMHTYLANLEDGWQCYKLYERSDQHGNMMFNIMSDNIVEQVFSFLLTERNKSLYSMVSGVLDKIIKHQNKVKNEIFNTKTEITKNAYRILDMNQKKADNIKEYRALWINTTDNDINKIALLRKSVGSCIAMVNLRERKCTCYAWQQSGIPCKHAIVAAKEHGRKYTHNSIAITQWVDNLWKTEFSKKMFNDIPALNDFCLPPYEDIAAKKSTNPEKYTLKMEAVPYERMNRNNKRILSTGEVRVLSSTNIQLKAKYRCPCCGVEVVQLIRHLESKNCKDKQRNLNDNDKLALRKYWEEEDKINVLTTVLYLSNEQVNAIFPGFFCEFDSNDEDPSISEQEETSIRLAIIEEAASSATAADTNNVTGSSLLSNPANVHHQSEFFESNNHVKIQSRKRSNKVLNENKYGESNRSEDPLILRRGSRQRTANNKYLQAKY